MTDIINIIINYFQLFFTAVLALYSIRLYQATSKYANLVEEQNKLVREQNENKRLVIKYNRLCKEMDNFVAILYSKRNDIHFFRVDHFYTKYHQTNDGDIREHYNPNYVEDFVSFWETIYRNRYLSQSKELNDLLHNYFATIETYKNLENNPQECEKHMHNILKRFNDHKKDLKPLIKNRYSGLCGEISDTEALLKIK